MSKRLSAALSVTLLPLLFAAVFPVEAMAKTPDWLKTAAGLSLLEYDKDTVAVQLLDEQIITVDNNGRVTTRYRVAYKILRPEGRDYAVAAVYFDKDTKLTYFKAWSIPAQGKDYEVKEKEAVETGLSDSSLYADTRYKVLKIPGADPGAVVGYEYEQKGRPFVLQDRWLYQGTVPIRLARCTLQLPAGWEFDATWINAPEQTPKVMSGNQWVWELQNIKAIEPERDMPPWRAVAGWVAFTFYPSTRKLEGKSHGSWNDVGAWYAKLAAGRQQPSPALQLRVKEITASVPTLLEKIRVLAAYAQRDIRYVAIEIGIGGYQPHTAQDIFSNGYGDCKDKATVLGAMLRELGIESHYVIINSSRGVTAPSFPSMLNFNHAILAIQLPEDVPTNSLYAVTEHETLGQLLFFDPTSSMTPLGYLPSYLQASHGLLVTGDGGELVKMPLLPSSTNRLLRTANLKLDAAGNLSGDVEEIRWGAPAISRRAAFVNRTDEDKIQVLENFLSGFLGGFKMTDGKVMNLEQYDENLVLQFSFVAPKYAKKAGSLLLVRPRVLGQKGDDLLEGEEERVHPVEFSYATLHTDDFKITLPPGYRIDELPPPLELDYGFAFYQSRFEVEGNTLRYTRKYEIRDIKVDQDKLPELKKFYRQVAADERASAILQRTQ